MPTSQKLNQPQHNYAFIDSQNLHMSVQAQGWKLDFKRFKSYLQSRHNVSKAFLFIGYLEEQTDMYQKLREMGYTLIFKPTVTSGEGEVKGNVDVELVLQTLIEWDNYKRAVIISGDGDFYSLVQHLQKAKKLEMLIIPNKHRYSQLYNEMPESKIRFMNNLKSKLTYESTARSRRRGNGRGHDQSASNNE